MMSPRVRASYSRFSVPYALSHPSKSHRYLRSTSSDFRRLRMRRMLEPLPEPGCSWPTVPFTADCPENACVAEANCPFGARYQMRLFDRCSLLLFDLLRGFPPSSSWQSPVP